LLAINRLKLSMQPEQYAAMLTTGVRFEKQVQPKAEAVTLRILVENPATAVPLSQVK
jgi:hypothetical protein